MAGIITIELTALRFTAYHGLYKEEKKTGNEFEVNLTVDFISDETIITSIEHTVNYAALYELAKKAMQQPRGLLETLAMEIVESIHVVYPQVTKASIAITKLHPPIIQFIGSVGVRYEKEF